jgi:hypothetical protein
MNYVENALKAVLCSMTRKWQADKSSQKNLFYEVTCYGAHATTTTTNTAAAAATTTAAAATAATNNNSNNVKAWTFVTSGV